MAFQSRVYVTVALDIEHDDKDGATDVLFNMDYEFKAEYEKDGRIVDTEIIEWNVESTKELEP